VKPVMIVLEFLFGCHHRGLSRVFTIGGRSYCVCWKCSATFAYSLAGMSLGPRIDRTSDPEPYPPSLAILPSRRIPL
jgi:hypothetical protein